MKKIITKNNNIIVKYDKKEISYSILKYGDNAIKLAEQSLKTGIRYENYIYLVEDYAILSIYCNQDKNYYEFLIDCEDINRIQKYKWGVALDFRKEKNINNRVCARNFNIGFLHRYIMNLNKDDNIYIDHISRNTFDNRKSNLRYVTNSINQKNKSIQKNNTSGYAGVTYNSSANVWTASIIDFNKKKITKSFSCNKYGNHEAKQLAINWRRNRLNDYGYINQN